MRLGAIRLGELLGEGTQGCVRAGVHEATGTAVAVKFLTAHAARNPAARAAFRHETAAVAALDHPHVIGVFDHGTLEDPLGDIPAGSPFLVMARAGGSARDWPLPLPLDRVRAVLLQVLDGLAHAHAHGIVHRDLKPANVLWNGRPEAPQVVLADFGMAFRDEDLEPVAGGTPLYMAPELVTSSFRDVGPWTDLYALGWIAWELATGTHPLAGAGRTPLEIAMDQCVRAPPGWEGDEVLGAWVERSLAKDPGDRFARSADARAALLGEPRPRVSPRRPAARRSARSPLLGAGLGLYGLRAIPLQGRDAECDALWAALAACAQGGAPGAIVVRGPSGAGKSRLAAWLCSTAHEAGAAAIVHAPSGAVDGVAAALARHLRVAGAAGPDAAAHVERILPGLARDLAAEPVLELVRGALAPGVAPFHAFGGDDERYAVAARLLAGIAADRPVVLWVDDAHEALDLLGLVRFLLRSGIGPILAVMTVRDEALAEAPAAAVALGALAAPTLEVGPLAAEHRVPLVRELLGLGGALVAEVAERTGGNPLFAVQLVGDWVQRGILVPGPDGFDLARGARARIPDDVFAVWSARVDRLAASLGEPAARALEVAAALGLEVDVGEWRAVCDALATPPPAELVDALRAARLAVAETGSSFALVHGMLRETLERRSAEADRAADQHRACARTLRSLDADPLRIGVHHLRAGDAADAFDALFKAGWDAFLHGAFVRGHQALDRIDAALPGLGDRQAFVEGLAWSLRGRLCVREFRLDEGVAWLERAADRFRALDRPRPLQVALDHLATAFLNVGDAEAGERAAAEAVAVGERSGDRSGLAYTRPTLARARAMQGRTEGALEIYRAAIAERASLADTDGLELAVADLLVEAGRPDEAIVAAEAAVARAEAGSHRGTLSVLLASLGTILRRAGRHDRADAVYRRALQLDERTGSRHAAFARALVGINLVEVGRVDEARPWLAVDLPPRSLHAPLLSAARLACAAAAGDGPAFEGALADLRSSRLQPGMRATVATLAGRAAAAWESRGDPARAALARAVADAAR